MAKKYQLTQDGPEVQALLNKVEGLKANQTPEQGATPTALETLALEGMLYSVMTKAVSDLVNYYTKSETYTKSEVNTMVAAIKQFTIQSVDALPQPPSAATMNILYLVPAEEPKVANEKDEFITVTKDGSYAWEQVGSTAIDLSDYVTTEALNTALANYVTSDALATALASLNDVKYTAQTLTDAQKAQARTNIGATTPEVFVAIYGTTTYAEIAAAIDDGKVVVVKRAINAGEDNESVRFYGNPQSYPGADFYIFSSSGFSYSGDGAIYNDYVAVDETEWAPMGEVNLESTFYKVSAWSSTPNDSKYPSEKLVKDSLDGKQPTIDAQHKLDYSLISNTPTIPTVESMTANEVTAAVNTAWDNVMNA